MFLALNYMIHRNHMYYIWKSAVHVNPDLPGTTHLRWIKDDAEYKPFITDKSYLLVPHLYRDVYDFILHFR